MDYSKEVAAVGSTLLPIVVLAFVAYTGRTDDIAEEEVVVVDQDS